MTDGLFLCDLLGNFEEWAFKVQKIHCFLLFHLWLLWILLDYGSAIDGGISFVIGV
jgi:hypothetical protein